MGNFGGHATPGSFFIVISLWHLVQLCISYFRSRRRAGPAFQSSTNFTSTCCPKFPLECIIKLVSVTGAVISEVVTGFNNEHQFVNIGNGQHICMYAFFGFTILLEILAFYDFSLPSGIVYIFYVLSFLIEAMLFYWHLHVQEPLEVQVHTLLIYVAIAIVCSIFVEMKYRRHILPALLRTFLILFHGVWFCQIAFILYPPSGWEKWDWKSHQQMMLVTILFCGDLFMTLLFCMMCWFVVAYRFRLVRNQQGAEPKNAYTPAPQVDTTFADEFKDGRNFFHFNDEDEEALISE